MYLGSSLETQRPGFLLGLATGILCQHFRKKEVFSINHIICTNDLGSVNHPNWLGNGRNTPETGVPRCPRRADLVSRPSSAQQCQVCDVNSLPHACRGNVSAPAAQEVLLEVLGVLRVLLALSKKLP